MKLIEFAPIVIQAVVGKELTQTALSIEVFGLSGANSPHLTKVLFPTLVARGLLAMRKKGNAKYFTATPKGIDSLV